MNNFCTRTLTALFLSLILLLIIQAPAWTISLIIASVAGVVLLDEWPRFCQNNRWFYWLTPLYPVLPFVFAIAINQDPTCRPLLLILIICVSVHDTGAYCAGKLVGQHKLCPSISPHKTWQGLAGGFLCVLGTLYIMARYTQHQNSYIFLVLLAALVSCIATGGDLFESWLKRKANLKDSGSLLPGHGGILDRCDGMMSCLYVLYPLRYVLLSFW